MSNDRVSDAESQSADDINDDRIVMYNAYAGVPTVKSEVKEETDIDSDVKPAPLHSVDAGISLMLWWEKKKNTQTCRT
jgi:hypothetical protein